MQPDAETSSLPAVVIRALSAFADGARLLRARPACFCLKRGRTNDTWRVTGDGADWVVRAGLGRDARLAIDRAREAGILALAAPAGFAPPLVHVMPAQDVLVTRYVQGEPLDAPGARAPRFLRGLGRRLRELHALPVPAGAVALDLRATLAHYLALAAPQHSPVPRAQIAGALRRHCDGYVPLRVALCHHDLHRANILNRAPLCFVDWEYAAWSDPLLELAAYVSYENLDAPGRAVLLDAYGPVPGLDPGALPRAVVLFDCLRALWLDAADAWVDVPAADVAALHARLAAHA